MTGVLPWWRDKLVAFDLESTGVDVFNDRIITATVVHVLPGSRPRIYEWIIDPGVDISPEATEIHGWTRDKLAAHPDVKDPAAAVFEISAALAYPMSHGVPVVAFNAAFDLSMLEAENTRYHQPTLATRVAPQPVGPILDPFVIDKQFSRRRGKRTLANQVEHYGVTLAGAHSSAGDALAAARLVPVMVEKYGLGDDSPGQLHFKQSTWRADQQASLADYFNRKGQEHDGCNQEWPVRTIPVEVSA